MDKKCGRVSEKVQRRDECYMYNYMSQGYMESRRKGGKEGTSVLQMLRVEEDTGDFEL